MTYSAQELVSLTKPEFITKEKRVEKNIRIEIVINTLAYIVMQKVDLDGMKSLMKELNEMIEGS
jgi:hypothetical protein